MSYQTRPLTPAGVIKTLPIIHAALIIGQVLFAAITLFITLSKPAASRSAQPDDVFMILVPVMAAGSVVLGQFMFKKLLAVAQQQATIQGKMARYQSAFIVRMALLEGASLFGIVVYLLTANPLFIGISGLLVIYGIWLRPTRQKTEDDLQLSYPDKLDMDNDVKSYN